MTEGTDISDDGEYEVVAHVYIKLFAGDTGSSYGRTQTQEFVDRRPVGVDLNKDRAVVTITNSGAVASDLVTLEWRLAFCTADYHGPQDGFTASHAQETGSSQIDSYLNVAYLQPGESRPFEIDFPKGPHNLENVYFQARVSTLWSGGVPANQWDFARDPAVTEAHSRI
ncbi:hypothetical protein [Rhizobium sp. Root483D2]|uniref:hypothetical protein n=1 Tax=Rhizobium sp. Root483D2 TaxID=1736545 RepID=UPI000712C61D|nr:hypothetical protein [Rhizobium sp. Root483D2]KQY25902.1 hypothetical protein ASD32_25820 [Rhizobium sp. Root483D2]